MRFCIECASLNHKSKLVEFDRFKIRVMYGFFVTHDCFLFSFLNQCRKMLFVSSLMLFMILT